MFDSQKSHRQEPTISSPSIKTLVEFDGKLEQAADEVERVTEALIGTESG